MNFLDTVVKERLPKPVVSDQAEIEAWFDRNLPIMDYPEVFASRGDETNVIIRDWDSSPIRICLVSAMPYRNSVGNLAIPLIYGELSDELGDSVVIDRAYFWETRKNFELMRKANIPVVSLNHRRSLAEFDVVAFSCSYLQTILHVGLMLDYCGIPYRREDRGSKHPMIVIGGHHMYVNPEPIHHVPDFIWLGEFSSGGVDAIASAAQFVSKSSPGFEDRTDWMLRYAGTSENPTKGFYLPWAYREVYSEFEPYAIADKYPIYPNIPKVIPKAYAANMDTDTYVNTKPIVSFVNPGMGTAEIQTSFGCDTATCTFCSEGQTNKPFRFMSVSRLVDSLQQMMRNSGMPNVTLSAFDGAGHPQKRHLIREILEKVSDSVSLLSLRVDEMAADDVFSLVSTAAGNKTLSLGVEGMSERMRVVYQKWPLHPDTRISTGRGYIRIKDVVVGDRVLTRYGSDWVKELHHKVSADNYKISLGDGTCIICDADHPFMTIEDDWVAAKDLKVGLHTFIKHRQKVPAGSQRHPAEIVDFDLEEAMVEITEPDEDFMDFILTQPYGSRTKFLDHVFRSSRLLDTLQFDTLLLARRVQSILYSLGILVSVNTEQLDWLDTLQFFSDKDLTLFKRAFPHNADYIKFRPYTINEFNGSGIHFNVPISRISTSQNEQDVICLTLDGDKHEFLAEGFVTHNCSEDQILRVCERAMMGGATKLKFFMICNHPWETEEDRMEWVGTLKKIEKIRARLNSKCELLTSWTPLVIMPFTPLQWEAPTPDDRTLHGIIDAIKTETNTKFRIGSGGRRDEAYMAQLLQLGDRRLSKLVDYCIDTDFLHYGSTPRGYKSTIDLVLSSILDQNGEPYSTPLSFETWFRTKPYSERLPWEHLGVGVSREWLLMVNEISKLGQQQIPTCVQACTACGACTDLDRVKMAAGHLLQDDDFELHEINFIKQRGTVQRTRIKVNIDFDHRFIGTEYWTAGMRRAFYQLDLPVDKANVKMVSSRFKHFNFAHGIEYFDVGLFDFVTKTQVEEIADHLPRGMTFVDNRMYRGSLRQLRSEVKGIHFRIDIRPISSIDKANLQLARLLHAREYEIGLKVIEYQKGPRTVMTDIRPWVLDGWVTSDGYLHLITTLLNPYELLPHMFRIPRRRALQLPIERVTVLQSRPDADFDIFTVRCLETNQPVELNFFGEPVGATLLKYQQKELLLPLPKVTVDTISLSSEPSDDSLVFEGIIQRMEADVLFSEQMKEELAHGNEGLELVT
jgi:radical SAM superfamily enzyme YgiQ (UPF0313 family)